MRRRGAGASAPSLEGTARAAATAGALDDGRRRALTAIAVLSFGGPATALETLGRRTALEALARLTALEALSGGRRPNDFGRSALTTVFAAEAGGRTARRALPLLAEATARGRTARTPAGLGRATAAGRTAGMAATGAAAGMLLLLRRLAAAALVLLVLRHRRAARAGEQDNGQG